jgi:nitroreductase/NAD-dependent dihydropyrimidine dehydrogenase PreA subunit
MGCDLHEKGVPAVNEATCTVCGQCIAACPDQFLTIENGKVSPDFEAFLGCIACGHCVAVCPTESIAVSGRGMKPDDSFDLPPSFHRATADQFEALVSTRRSIRRFTNQEVDRATIDRILEMTATAPMGIPPSEVGVVVLHGRDRVQAFAADACAAFGRMARFLNPVMLTLMRPFWGKETYEVMRGFIKPLMEMLAKTRSEGEDWFTYNAPAALLFHYGPMGGQADCHIAATYAMLAAESLGLGNCMLGTTEAFNHVKSFKSKYGIPPKNKIGLGLVLGYPAESFRRGVRRRLASVRFA